MTSSSKRLAWLLGCAAWCNGGALHAQTSPGAQLNVVVRVCSERDRHALERLRGQTSDLPVSLVTRDADPLEPTLERQLDRAEQLAAELSAAAVVWFDERPAALPDAPGALIVYVATPGNGRVLVSRLEIGAAGGQVAGADDAARLQAASGLLEQSALVVRFALKGLASGGAIGVERGSALAPPAPSNEQQPSAEPDTATTLEPERSGAEGSRALWLALGYELAVDGFAPAGEHALWLRASQAFGSFEAALFTAAGLPAERAADPAGMRLLRVRGGAAFAARAPLGASWSLSAGAHAGVMLLRRETIVQSSAASPRPARWSAALVLGPEASAHTRAFGLGLLFGAALDVLPSPTHFVLYDGERQVDGAQPWRVQPRVFVAAELAP